MVESFSDGIHGFLFLFNIGNPRFTEEEKEAFQQIENVIVHFNSFITALVGLAIQDPSILSANLGLTLIKYSHIKLA